MEHTETEIGSAYSPDFGGALAALKSGRKVTRAGWNGKGMYLALQIPDENSANKKPYVYIVPVDGQRIPWTASQSDILADDWIVVEN